MYSIFDVKADVYNVPFFAPTNGVAIRQFSDLANDAQSSIARHPEDFKLCCVGEFDDGNATIVPVFPVESLGFATEYIQKSNVEKLKKV